MIDYQFWPLTLLAYLELLLLQEFLFNAVFF